MNSKILCIEQLDRARKQQFIRAAVLSTNISQIFSLIWITANICFCLFKLLFNWPLTFFTSFNKFARIQTDSCENFSTAEMGFQLVPKYMLESKTDQIVFPNIYLKQFISSKIGGEVVILANSLIFHFQLSLRHSALISKH